jgi:hypothetical protein
MPLKIGWVLYKCKRQRDWLEVTDLHGVNTP